MRGLGSILIILSAIGAPPAVAGATLFTASSDSPERHRQSEVRPPQALVRLVLASIDSYEVETLDSCIAEHRITRGDYGSLLSAVRIRASPGRALWFVRPALRPFCQTLYGAHAFSYFLFEERIAPVRPRYRLVFHNRGDTFAVYRRLRHGLNDIEATGCTAIQCFTTRLAYDGIRYRAVQCSDTLFASGRGITRRRPCGRDG